MTETYDNGADQLQSLSQINKTLQLGSQLSGGLDRASIIQQAQANQVFNPIREKMAPLIQQGTLGALGDMMQERKMSGLNDALTNATAGLSLIFGGGGANSASNALNLIQQSHQMARSKEQATTQRLTDLLKTAGYIGDDKLTKDALGAVTAGHKEAFDTVTGAAKQGLDEQIEKEKEIQDKFNQQFKIAGLNLDYNKFGLDKDQLDETKHYHQQTHDLELKLQQSRENMANNAAQLQIHLERAREAAAGSRQQQEAQQKASFFQQRMAFDTAKTNQQLEQYKASAMGAILSKNKMGQPVYTPQEQQTRVDQLNKMQPIDASQFYAPGATAPPEYKPVDTPAAPVFQYTPGLGGPQGGPPQGMAPSTSSLGQQTTSKYTPQQNASYQQKLQQGIQWQIARQQVLSGQ